MEAILNFSTPDFDVNLFDQVVAEFYNGSTNRQNAQQVLTAFQDHPDSWQRCGQILELSNMSQSKYMALSILDKLIQSRWKLLSNDQKLGIRNFVVNMIIALCEDDSLFNNNPHQKSLINKCDLTLVQIIKKEWPDNWPNFIPELVASSRSSFNVCENNMIILKLLSEEIFDNDQLTQAKAQTLKKNLSNEFQEIFKLCYEVLDKSDKQSLIYATLDCLLRYLHWIPVKYIFDTNILDILTLKFLPVSSLRSINIKCLTEISSLKFQSDAETSVYNPKLAKMFTESLIQINSFIPINSIDLKVTYANSNTNDQTFLQDLAIYLTTFLGNNYSYLESTLTKSSSSSIGQQTIIDSGNCLLIANNLLVELSRIDERELFKACIDYWLKFVHGLFLEIQQLPENKMNPMFQLGHAHTFNPSAGALDPAVLLKFPLRTHHYSLILSKLRLVVIGSMARPEEVLIVENDEGEIVRELVRETDTITLYKTMRELLIYLTHLDVLDTEMIMSDKLAKQIDGSEWSWHNINTLCWAIGSISGTMSEAMEKQFLVTVIKDLLALTEMKRGKDNKAVVASNIMYIVGQYPRFLKAHWRFLKTVVNKLFEFMHETHEGVQDMACDTFIKITKKCKRHFTLLMPGESEPFINEILRTMDTITEDLQPQQVHTFCEACGIIISSEPVKQAHDKLLEGLMRLPNLAWQAILDQAVLNTESSLSLLMNPETVKIIANIIKTNVAVCKPLGQTFYPQLSLIYVNMLFLYQSTSGLISSTVAMEGEIATKTPKVRGLRTIKKEILKLIEIYISQATNLQQVVDDFVGPLLNCVLDDYRTNVPDARDSEVLKCMTTVVLKVGQMIPDGVIVILQNVFECTLDMINKDLTNYPEHRIEFYKLLKAINTKCFNALLNLSRDAFKQLIDAILWSFKHINRDVEDCGLALCNELLINVVEFSNSGSNSEFANGFFQSFYFMILSDLFFVLTNGEHKAGFILQCQILATLITLVAENKIQTSLAAANPSVDVSAGSGSNENDNVIFVKLTINSMLTNEFPQVSADQISKFIMILFNLYNDKNVFQGALHDFLVQTKEYGADE